MAKIDWTPRFLRLLYRYIDNACIEYGTSTANKWAEEVSVFEHRIESYPTSYSPEGLLKGKSILYRSCHVMSRRSEAFCLAETLKEQRRLAGLTVATLR